MFTSTCKRLADLTAQDLMSREVVTIPQDMSLRGAARRLDRAGISGAPVVDAAGRCVGVLSKTDLMRFLDRGLPADAANCPAPEQLRCCDWEVAEPDDDPPIVTDVTRCMTPRPITAPPDAPVADLARIMHEEQIHRILIADQPGRVIGVVSSLDILAAVAAEAAADLGRLG